MNTNFLVLLLLLLLPLRPPNLLCRYYRDLAPSNRCRHRLLDIVFSKPMPRPVQRGGHESSKKMREDELST